MTRTPGVSLHRLARTGPLDVGQHVCLALRLDGLDETAHVFTVMSDGDLQEGESWEGAMSAAHFEIPNLTAIVTTTTTCRPTAPPRR